MRPTQSFKKPSLTVPGQSISVSELFARQQYMRLPDTQKPIVQLKSDADFDSAVDISMDKFEALEKVRSYESAMREYKERLASKQREESERELYKTLSAKYGSNSDKASTDGSPDVSTVPNN